MKASLLLATALLGLSLSGNAAAAYAIAPGKITYIENGWLGEGLALHVSGSGVSGCTAQPTEFAIGKDHPAYRDMVAIALSAFASSSDVEIVAEAGTCLFGNRTKVLAIRLRK